MAHEHAHSDAERCAYCAEPAGSGDWADRQWGLIEEPGPGGVPITRQVHATCYLHRHKSTAQPNRPRFRPGR